MTARYYLDGVEVEGWQAIRAMATDGAVHVIQVSRGVTEEPS